MFAKMVLATVIAGLAIPAFAANVDVQLLNKGDMSVSSVGNSFDSGALQGFDERQ